MTGLLRGRYGAGGVRRNGLGRFAAALAVLLLLGSALSTDDAHGQAPSGPSLSVAPATVVAGGTVTATWSGIANPSPTDWVGLYRPGSPNDNPGIVGRAWIYLTSGSKLAGPAGAASGSATWAIPLTVPAGTYEPRLFTNDTFIPLASGATLTVTAAPVPQAVSPFEAIGFLQKATLDPSCINDVFCGGTMVVNGLTITVPRNTLFQFPATNMTWQEMFKLAPAPHGLNAAGGPQSGLALSDTPTPLTTYEVTVIGNRIARTAADDKYIAGLIFLSQQSLNTGNGFVNAIDYETGEIWVGSTLTARTGARLRLNTPEGRYGKPDPNADPRFTADEENPTVHAETGYPMCIPRTNPAVADDPLCPQRNRPKDPVTGVYQTVFSMGRSPDTTPSGPALGPLDPDPTQQAPFEVGDFVDYSGTLVKDPQCTPSATDPCQYISVHTLGANLAIYTAPGVMPAYIWIEAMLLGTGGLPNPLFPQEAVEKLVMVAFTTDPTRLVDVYAVDVDSCGNESSRFYVSGDPGGIRQRAKRGRVAIAALIGNFLPASRDMRVATRTFTAGRTVDQALASARTYANGLVAGQYRAPNFDFIFPENMVLGGPPVPQPFEEFPFLANGSGPYFGAGPNGQATAYGNLGQLNPWPGVAAPTALGCGPAGVLRAPVANAGLAQTVNSGALVSLDGGGASADTNSPPLPLSYTWLQTGGPAVVLSNNASPAPTFTAPPVPSNVPPEVLTFALTVNNGYTHSAISTVTVTVVGQQAPIVNPGAAQAVSSAAAVTLSGSATDPSAPLTYRWNQVGGPTVSLTGSNAATATFTAPTMAVGQAPVTLTFQLTVTNQVQLSSSATTTVTVRPLPDRVFITQAIWRFNKSRLIVTASSTVTNGNPVLTLKIPGKPDVVLHYDPIARNYTTGAESLTINPAPSNVAVVSSFGGTSSAPVTIRP